ncbi:MAG: 1-deoxy-D-xylulose 5-phosphate reductoisomerase [Desulfovibrio sp.]
MISYISSLPENGLQFPRAVAILGSTGSIGVSTLSVLADNPGLFRPVALAAGRNAALLAEQAKTWRPPHLAVLDETTAITLKNIIAPLAANGYTPHIHVGSEGYAAIASLPEADVVVSAQVGAAGLAATYAAVAAGKTVALANKESLVLAGHLVRETAAKTGAVILPVDSEHNAIFQALFQGHSGQQNKSVSRLILTASGGPFRGKDAAFLETVTPAMALNHPNWSMGAKITVDSATMMNKGLEVIEACHLYGVPLEAIDVLVHPQSVVHSLVEFSDASLLAQAGPPDMRIAISYCLSWPKRCVSGVAPLDLAATGSLTFEKPDVSVFRCLSLAKESLRAGGGMPVVLNAANEIAVDAFLQGRIGFAAIARFVENAMNRHAKTRTAANLPAGIEEIIDLDRETRQSVAGAV